MRIYEFFYSVNFKDGRSQNLEIKATTKRSADNVVDDYIASNGGLTINDPTVKFMGCVSVDQNGAILR